MGVTSSREFVGMRSHHQLHRRVRQSRARHHAIREEEHTTSRGIRQAYPAYILAVGHRLRLREGDELLGYLALMLLDILAGLAVTIVIDGAATVVGIVVVSTGEDELIAQTTERQRGLIRRQVRAKLDASVGIHSPDSLRCDSEVILTEGMCLILRELILTRSLVHRERSAIGSLRAYGEEELYRAVGELSDLLLEDTVLEVVQTIRRPSRAHPDIVVSGSTEGRDTRPIAWVDDRIASIDELVDRPFAEVVLHGEVTTSDLIDLLRQALRTEALAPLQGFSLTERLQGELLISGYIACLSPRLVGAQTALDLNEVLTIRLEV